MTRGALQRGKVLCDEDSDRSGFPPCSGTLFSPHPRIAELLPPGPQVGRPAPLLPALSSAAIQPWERSSPGGQAPWKGREGLLRKPLASCHMFAS